MKDTKLQKILIALSIILSLSFILIKNFDKIPFEKLQSKSEEDVEIEEPQEENNEIENSNEKDLIYGVSSVNPLVSEVGMEVLENGGNAIDAAVAMSFTLNVADPQNSGIGGGGGMLIVDGSTDEKIFYDYYMSSGDVEPKNDIGIPGFLKGMETINKEMGNKELSELIQYAIDVGEEGIEVTQGYEENLERYNYIATVHPSFEKNGETLKKGDMVYQPELLETFEKIQEYGADIFYNGEDEISKNFLEITGISQESLKNYEVYKHEPLEIEYRGYNIIGPPAPFSGLTVLQDLLIEKEIDIPERDFENIEYNNTMRDISKYTARESRKTIGDPKFVEIDYDKKLNIDYLMSEYTADIKYDEDYKEPESASTTPFSVIDKDGMMVSATNTLSNYWGAFVVRDGIIYNNAMKNFTSGKNKFEFNKRPKTGIAPMIITSDDSHREVLATSGGARIPDYLFKMIVDSKKDNVDMQMANDIERMYYYRREMYFEKYSPYFENENRVINFDDEYREFYASNLWGLANGIEINKDGEVNAHIDKRGYFEGKYIYSKGNKKFMNE